MGLTAPIFIIGLIGVPLVIIYHIFRPKSTELVVSSTILWERALTESGRKTVWDRFLRNVLLILQIAAVVLSVLFLSGLYLSRTIMVPEKHVLVMDTSASMAASDVEPSRLVTAQLMAMEYLASLPQGSEVALYEFNRTIASRQGFTRDIESVKKTIGELRVRNTITAGDQLVSLLSILGTGSEQPVSVAVFTDGGFDVARDLFGGEALNNVRTRVYSVSGQGDNVAVTGFTMRQSEYGGTGVEVLASIENFGQSRKDFIADIFVGQQLAKSERVKLDPGGQDVVTASFTAVPSTEIRVNLDVDDCLSVDNSATLWPDTRGTSRVLLVTQRNRSLYAALSAIPGIKVTIIQPGQLGPTMMHGYDAVVFDEMFPTFPVATSYAAIMPKNGTPQVQVASEYPYPRVLYADRTDAIMRYVDEQVLIGESGQELQLLAGAEAVAYGAKGPLIAAGEDGGHRFVYFGFPFTARNFVNSPSLPILVSNTISFLLGGGSGARSLLPGEPIYAELAEPGGQTSTPGPIEVKVTRPDGSVSAYSVDGDSFVYTDTEETGLYEIFSKGSFTRYCVNLFDRTESDTCSSAGIGALRALDPGVVTTDQDSSLAVATGDGARERVDLSLYLMAAAAVLSAIEWLLYNRRLHL